MWDNFKVCDIQIIVIPEGGGGGGGRKEGRTEE